MSRASVGSVEVSQWWSLHQAELRRWLVARLPTPQDAEDVLQEVFLKALRQGERLTHVAQPRAWLFEVARHALIDRQRQSVAPEPLTEELLASLPFDEVELAPVDRLAQTCLPRVLQELDAQDREAIEACDLQGMTQGSFARAKGLTLAAAKSCVQRARQRMREHMLRVCQVQLGAGGGVEDFVPRAPDGAAAAATPAHPRHGRLR
ncbi:sigma-70 family RNA polymerase sigma factor [Tepidimonas charontis]|uniref:RNA polymerase sigma factor n=1 Tax=Tepidimonas charontis TaxID=2267262 RepID=A0A554XDK2_9BURK|nr:sigma-70 family RNA polymerase sigma factor [Tepidimonas charontis]TSE33918.1 ECF RNA polymerase sigma factor SigM [Tepidimonas charontis]